ncbi:MAG: hypothetical protein FJ285_00775 [Planctomycetes bacterium]|nr:hypothetical protein [Planctomycetota bacterium]
MGDTFPAVDLVLRTLERVGFLVVDLAATDVRVLLAGFTFVRDFVFGALPARDDFATVLRFFGMDLVVGMSFSLVVRTRAFPERRRLGRCGILHIG